MLPSIGTQLRKVHRAPKGYGEAEFDCPHGQKDLSDVAGHVEVGCCIPSGSVEQQNGAGALGGIHAPIDHFAAVLLMASLLVYQALQLLISFEL